VEVPLNPRGVLKLVHLVYQILLYQNLLLENASGQVLVIQMILSPKERERILDHLTKLYFSVDDVQIPVPEQEFRVKAFLLLHLFSGARPLPVLNSV